jgi:excisionase family DNA binding protein
MAVSTPFPIEASQQLLDVRAVARLLDCSVRHVYRLADGGRMPPPLKLGALVRWRRSDIEQWLTAGAPRRPQGPVPVNANPPRSQRGRFANP